MFKKIHFCQGFPVAMTLQPLGLLVFFVFLVLLDVAKDHLFILALILLLTVCGFCGFRQWPQIKHEVPIYPIYRPERSKFLGCHVKKHLKKLIILWIGYISSCLGRFQMAPEPRKSAASQSSPAEFELSAWRASQESSWEFVTLEATLLGGWSWCCENKKEEKKRT